VDTGRKAGGKRVPLDVLIQWIRIKKIDLRGRSEKSVAFAMQTAIHKKGIPTDGDTDKKYFMTNTIKRLRPEIESRLRSIIQEAIRIEFVHMIDRARESMNEFNYAA
jgi:hypothetical protein